MKTSNATRCAWGAASMHIVSHYLKPEFVFAFISVHSDTPRRTPLQGNFKNPQQQENGSVEFFTQRREGAKIINSLTLRLRAFA